MSDYEVTLVNDNSMSSPVPRHGTSLTSAIVFVVTVTATASRTNTYKGKNSMSDSKGPKRVSTAFVVGKHI